MPMSATQAARHVPARAPQGRRSGRRLLAPLGSLAAVAGAFTYVGLVDPNRPGHYPVCPLYALTGVYCPACGGLRCAHAVAHGDLGAALGDNALAVVGFALALAAWVTWTVLAARGLPWRLRIAPGWWWTLGVLVVAFTVVRNLPFGAALAP
jgi:hypothetical protein